MSILHIEDNEAHAMLTARMLRPLNIDLVQFPTADDALRWLDGNQASLVIADIALGGTMDGFDFAEILRQDERWYNVPIIISSAHDSMEARERADRLGVAAYLVKPTPADMMRRVVVDVLGQASSS